MHRSPDHTDRALVAESLAPLLLRAAVGYGLAMHDDAKRARGPDTFAVVLHTLGVPWSGVLAWLTTRVELVGGLGVLAGTSRGS